MTPPLHWDAPSSRSMARVPFSNSKENFRGGGSRPNLHYGAREGFFENQNEKQTKRSVFCHGPGAVEEVNGVAQGEPLTAKKWRTKIKSLCKRAGVEAKDYAPVIDSLAEILEQRDQVMADYREDGDGPIVEHTNKAGATNMTRSPYLDLWDMLNKTALAYWRELGLTPAAYKKVCGAAPKNAAVGTLAAALREIELDTD